MNFLNSGEGGGPSRLGVKIYFLKVCQNIVQKVEFGFAETEEKTENSSICRSSRSYCKSRADLGVWKGE